MIRATHWQRSTKKFSDAMKIYYKTEQQVRTEAEMAQDFIAAGVKGCIIACHCAWPWHDELIALLLHKANVVMETSGWAPKYFPPALKREINDRLQDKVMFGSDYPVLAHARLFKEFEEEGYKPEVLEKIYITNPQRILGLKV